MGDGEVVSERHLQAPERENLNGHRRPHVAGTAQAPHQHRLEAVAKQHQGGDRRAAPAQPVRLPVVRRIPGLEPDPRRRGRTLRLQAMLEPLLGPLMAFRQLAVLERRPAGGRGG